MHRSLLFTAMAAVPLVQGSNVPRKDGYASTSYSTAASETCNTILGVLPLLFGAATFTFHSTSRPVIRITSTTMATVVITPAPFTSTVEEVTETIQTITPPPITSIFSTTSTIFATVSETITPLLATSTTTRVESSTTYTTTSVISASAGFLGVQETYFPRVKAKRGRPNTKRVEKQQFEKRGWLKDLWNGVFHPKTASAPSPTLTSLRAVALGSFELYPLVVNCHVTTVISTMITTVVVGPLSTATAHAITIIETSTITTTSTSTLPPETITGGISSFRTTQTATTTTTLPQNTFTSTTTSTLLIPQPTDLYLACGATNILGPTLPAAFGSAAGDVISDILYDATAVNLITTVGDSAYECCVQCLTTTGCAYGGFTADGRCWLEVTVDKSCPTQMSGTEFGEYVSAPPPVDLDWAVYNGNCGIIGYGGADPNFGG